MADPTPLPRPASLPVQLTAINPEDVATLIDGLAEASAMMTKIARAAELSGEADDAEITRHMAKRRAALAETIRAAAERGPVVLREVRS